MILQPIGSSSTICDATADEKIKIFKLELDVPDPNVTSQLSWKVNKFDIASETFVEYKASEGTVQQTQRICVSPGTYEFVITSSDMKGMGVGGSYTGTLFGDQIFNRSDGEWEEQRHIFCYGECASTSPSLSPPLFPTESPSTLPSMSPSKEPTPLPSLSPSKEPTLLPSLGPSSQPSFAPSVEPTPSPSATPTKIIAEPLPGGQQAEYDPNMKVPKCSTLYNSCSTGNLVASRGSMDVKETNAPNSLDNCTDSDKGQYAISESIEAITVSSVTQEIMKGGDNVTVTANVTCWHTGDNDWADFYHATNVGDGEPQWKFIGSQECPGSKARTLSVSYELPTGKESFHAVRVNFSYRVGNRTNTSCSQAPYGDVDDLAFIVKGNAEFQELLI